MPSNLDCSALRMLYLIMAYARLMKIHAFTDMPLNNVSASCPNHIVSPLSTSMQIQSSTSIVF